MRFAFAFAFAWIAAALLACGGSPPAPAPSDGGAPIADGGGSADDGGTEVPSAELIELGRQLGVYRNGGTITLDSTSQVTVTVSPDGSKTTILTVNGKERQRIEASADGLTVDETGDVDGDGRPDHTKHLAITATQVVQEELFDKDYDGTMDYRVSAVTDLTQSPPSREITVETLADGGVTRLAHRIDTNGDFQCETPPPTGAGAPDQSNIAGCNPWRVGPQSWEQAQPISLPVGVGDLEFRILTDGPGTCNSTHINQF